MYDLIVIGGGPAALAAGLYAIGKQLNIVMVYEELGGKIGWLQSLVGPEQPPDLPGNEIAHLLMIRATTYPERAIEDRVLSVFTNGPIFNVLTEQHGVLHSRTVLVATGATPLQLDVPGAQQVGKVALSYSATTYAHLTGEQRIAVIGGTNRALSAAAELANTAAQVFLVAPGPLALSTPLGEALRQHPRVEVLAGWKATRIERDDPMITVTIAQGRHLRPLSVDRVFVALGLVPNSDMVRDLVATDSDGFIKVNAFHQTSVPGLFAAGDVSSIFSEQVLIAIGDGTRAAMAAYDYLLSERLVADVLER
ncbi:MAG TPA: NAD(P)/FAD-dependent oxidoreductase [Herpetosiphonaceae bacterium]